MQPPQVRLLLYLLIAAPRQTMSCSADWHRWHRDYLDVIFAWALMTVEIFVGGLFGEVGLLLLFHTAFVLMSSLSMSWPLSPILLFLQMTVTRHA